MRQRYEPKPSYTQEQFAKAASVPLLPFMQERGYQLIKKGNEYHLREHDSFVVSKNKWCWNSRHMGGNVISLLTRVENMDFVSAVLLLAGEEYSPMRGDEQEEKIKGDLILPKENSNCVHVIAYLLKTRGLDKDIVYDMIRKKSIYESREYYAYACVNADEMQYRMIKAVDYSTFDKMKAAGIIHNQSSANDLMLGTNNDGKVICARVEDSSFDCLAALCKQKKIKSFKEHNNCVFVGRDKDGAPKFASMRSDHADSSFRQDIDNSNKRFPFYMEGKSDTAFFFESPIDAMSHAALFKHSGFDWQKDYRVSMSGLNTLSIDGFLETHPHIKNIGFCVDNDKAGKEHLYGVYDEENQIWRVESLLTRYKERGYNTFPALPRTKDYNQDLCEWLKCRELPYFQEDGEELE